MKNALLSAALLAATLLIAAEPVVLFTDSLDNAKAWRALPNNKPEVAKVSAVDGILKVDFHIDDPKTVYGWPQTLRNLKPELPIAPGMRIEFDACTQIRSGQLAFRVSPRPLNMMREFVINLPPGKWTRVSAPVLVSKGKECAALNGIALCISGRAAKPGDDYSILVKNLRVVSGVPGDTLTLTPVGDDAKAPAAAADPVALYTEPFDNIKAWRLEPRNQPEVIKAAIQDGALKIDFRVDDPKTVYGWPQAGRGIPPVALQSNDVYIECDALVENRAGAIAFRVVPRPIGAVKAPLPNVPAGQWTHLSLPVSPMKPGAKLEGIAFCIAGRSAKPGDDYSLTIKNLRVVRGKSFADSLPKLDSTGQPLRDGMLSCKVVPAASRPLDDRLEIMIPNLLVNGYFREGGPKPPAPGWNCYGGESYGESRHGARSIHLPGLAGKTMALRQNGLVLVPGEKYRLSGYIRGGGFTGHMEGHIGTAGPRWSKIRGYFFTDKDIKPDWQYFEVEFTPAPSASGEYEGIIYRSGNGGGWIEVDRVILEAISPKAIAGSRNKYGNDKFEANYDKARAEGKLRAGPPSPDYKLVWSDEFDGTKVDESKWKIYTMDFKGTRPYVLIPDCVALDGKGHLLMTTRLGKNGKVESPRLCNTERHPFTYGYVECRFKLHDTPLANASFWMLPEGHMDARDPVHKGMEIDIMECVNPIGETLSHTTHWYSLVKETNQRLSFSGGTRARHAPGLHDGFHTVGLEWTPTDLFFFIDGVQSWHLNTKDHPIPVCPHNIILSFGGRNPEILKLKEFSTTWTVDYVRLYQKK